MLIAPRIDTTGSLYIYLQQINATFFGPMLAVILCGLLTRRVPARAAKVALIAGPIAFYLLNFSFDSEFQHLTMRMFQLSEPLHFLHVLAIVFVLTLILMAVMSYRASATHLDPRERSTSPVVDVTPWRWARLAAVLISVATIGIYVLLAQ